MNFMRLGTRFLNNSSPLTLLATGAVIAIAFPPVRRGLRSAAVMTTRGALALADSVKEVGDRIKESTADIVSEARDYSDSPQETFSETVDCIKDTVKNQSRRVVVATTAGALALSDKAKRLRRNFKDVVEEARANLEDRDGEDDAFADEDSNNSPHGSLDTDLENSRPHNRHKD
ncbi:hypothetical protein P22_3916 [Propionispora sp. 2/2-37]|uniref:hypothetical protein n=1 Tax=Propionispora sp. 2/2-37 TaxID=1677858 RepID=UPI0006BB5F5D|nr:hypothetical protein [Propionispora sp. 2/2-37]CUH97772.1 hypothetical protein P22_3916 [Propionispora sp. 2/2-37]